MKGRCRLMCAPIAMLICGLLMSSCASPPVEELARAQKALDDARAKEADIYLEEGFKKAEAALSKAKEALARKSYKDARSAAEEAAAEAQLLSSRTDAAKARMKADADGMLGEVKEQTDELKRLVAEVGRRGPPASCEEARTLIGKNEVDLINVKIRLQNGKVRQAFDDLKLTKSLSAAQAEKLKTFLAAHEKD